MRRGSIETMAADVNAEVVERHDDFGEDVCPDCSAWKCSRPVRS
jgi:hypothetical protein